jgi:hypothetical protein
MSDNPLSGSGSESASAADTMSALFAQLVIQQTNMAMMLLGRLAHPESGKLYKDVDAARLFIDQLEMLEIKTKGNLSKDESALLKQSLMNLRLAFVEAVESPEPASAPASASAPAGAPANQSAAQTSQPAATAEDEHKKKFSKKY